MGVCRIPSYGRCTINRMFSKNQCTIQWYVDDLKISHKNPTVITNIIKKLERAYGKVNPLTVSRGKVHDYLGMTLDYRTKGKLKLTMYK